VNDLRVVAGVLSDDTGRVLIAQRPSGKALAGRWEFPGGKINADESELAALCRELAEEIGIHVLAAEPLMVVRHHYPQADRGVEVAAWRVTAWQGVPQSLDGQALQWCLPAELSGVDLLEADRPIITALRLPRQFVRASVPQCMAHYVSHSSGASLAWLFDHSPDDVLRNLIEAAQHLYFEIGADSDLRLCRGGNTRFTGYCVGTLQDCHAAIAIGADFLLLHDPIMAAHDWRALSGLGVPWYANPLQLPAGVIPVGTLSWDSEIRTDLSL
jgi:8-oxo-dGTP pyrophosphatase MutT (NUDIX family)